MKLSGNPSGKYNLNFIDPTNDICAYYSRQRDDPEFAEIDRAIEQYFRQVTIEHQSDFVPTGGLTQPQQNKVKTEELQMTLKTECAVCMEKFKKKQVVKQLPCKHFFHNQCIGVWFKNNSKCPLCRFDLAA